MYLVYQTAAKAAFIFLLCSLLLLNGCIVSDKECVKNHMVKIDLAYLLIVSSKCLILSSINASSFSLFAMIFGPQIAPKP